MSDQHNLVNESQIAVMAEQIEATRSDVRAIKKCLLEGNGVPAMTVRVAKMEQIIAAIVWVTGIVSASVLGIIVVAVVRIAGKS